MKLTKCDECLVVGDGDIYEEYFVSLDGYEIRIDLCKKCKPTGWDLKAFRKHCLQFLRDSP